MVIQLKSLDLIQSAGEALHQARVALTTDVSEIAAALSSALMSSPQSLEIDRAFAAVKDVARLAHELASLEERLKDVYLQAADQVKLERRTASSAIGTTSLPMVATNDRVVVDAMEVQPRPTHRKRKAAKVLAKKPKAVSSVSVQPVAAPPIKKGNDQRVLTYLQSRLNRKSFVRLPGREIAAGAALPLGSVAASVRELIKAGLVINQERGYYKLA